MRFKRGFIFISLLVLTALNGFAQNCEEGPGLPGEDPDGVPCDLPLDNWVVLFAVITVAFTVIYLHRKQKAALQN
jgi:hypothetical protein